MHEVDSLMIFPRCLDGAGIDYMTTGSIAGIIYGEPRVTHDVDMVVHLKTGEIDKLQKAFPDDEFYCPPYESLCVEIARETRGHFNIIHHASGLKADFYPLGNDELHRWAFPLRKQEDFHGVTIWLAPPEYVILRKLQYYAEGKSEKHLRDIKNMLTCSGDQIDMLVLDEKIKISGLEALWREFDTDINR